MKCKACGGAITTAVCPYCRAVDPDLYEKEQQRMQEDRARLERLEERQERREIRADKSERKAKFWDRMIIGFACLMLLELVVGLDDIFSPNSEVSFQSQGHNIVISLSLGVGLILWVVYRKKSRKASATNNE